MAGKRQGRDSNQVDGGGGTGKEREHLSNTYCIRSERGGTDLSWSLLCPPCPTKGFIRNYSVVFLTHPSPDTLGGTISGALSWEPWRTGLGVVLVTPVSAAQSQAQE